MQALECSDVSAACKESAPSGMQREIQQMESVDTIRSAIGKGLQLTPQ